MKTYTGFEALERMKTNWITRDEDKESTRWKFNCKTIECESEEGDIFESGNSINFFFRNKFVDYIEPLKFEEGEMFVFYDYSSCEKWYLIYQDETEDWLEVSLGVVVSAKYVDKYGGKIGKQSGEVRKATDEELQEFERFMMFHKKGRKMDEFQLGDIGEHEDTLYKVVVHTEDNKFEGVVGCVAINEKDAPVKYFPVNAVELQFCVEDMVG